MGFPVDFPLNQSNEKTAAGSSRGRSPELRSNDWTARSPLRGDSWRLVGGFHDHLMTQVIWIVIYKLYICMYVCVHIYIFIIYLFIYLSMYVYACLYAYEHIMTLWNMCLTYFILLAVSNMYSLSAPNEDSTSKTGTESVASTPRWFPVCWGYI